MKTVFVVFVSHRVFSWRFWSYSSLLLQTFVLISWSLRRTSLQYDSHRSLLTVSSCTASQIRLWLTQLHKWANTHAHTRARAHTDTPSFDDAWLISLISSVIYLTSNDVSELNETVPWFFFFFHVVQGAAVGTGFDRPGKFESLLSAAFGW